MKRTIDASAHNPEGYLKTARLNLKLTFDMLTIGETQREVEKLRNELHDFLRAKGFNHSQITIR